MGLYILRLIVLVVCTWAGAVLVTKGSMVSGIIGAAVALWQGRAVQFEHISDRCLCSPICMAWQGSWWGSWPAL